LTGKILDQVGVGSIPGEVLTERVRFAPRVLILQAITAFSRASFDGAASAGALRGAARRLLVFRHEGRRLRFEVTVSRDYPLLTFCS
jgi:hypothetical protein